jgi:hypothetical protein
MEIVPTVKFKGFTKITGYILSFKPNEFWRTQFLEWDIEPTQVDIMDKNGLFQRANYIYKKTISQASSYNHAGIVNLLYDNIFQYLVALIIIVQSSEIIVGFLGG